MDFLKYLDIVIGLAVVMVLISPMVTAVTQFAMWMGRRRPRLLQRGLAQLVLQLDGRQPALLMVRDGAGGAAAGVRVDGMGQTDADGCLWLPEGIPAAAVRGGNLTLTLNSGAPAVPAAGHVVELRLIPQRTLEMDRVVSAPTDAHGQARLSYAYAGDPMHAPYEAVVTVKDAAGTPVPAARVRCTVGSAPPFQLPAAGGGLTFSHPAAAGGTPPASFDVALEAVDAGGAGPLAGHTVEFAFQRNQRSDLVTVSRATDMRGTATIARPSSIDGALADEVARAVLLHPVIAKTPVGGWLRFVPLINDRRGEVVEREELIRILLELAAGEGGAAGRLKEPTRQALLRVLRENGIAMPAVTLADIRRRAQEMEQADPQEQLHVRQAKAIIAAARSDLVGKVNQWFDAAMTRTTQQYTAEARVATVVGALLVAMTIQMDSLDLLRRLSVDDSLRATLLKEAEAQQEQIKQLRAAPGDSPTAVANELEAARAARAEIQKTLATLRAPGLAIVPDQSPWAAPLRARLVRNPLWTGPYPASLELVAGGSQYTIVPDWRRDPLTDLKLAIEAVRAPVRAEIVDDGDDLIIRTDRPTRLELVRGTATSENFAMPMVTVAQAHMDVERWAKAKGAAEEVLKNASAATPPAVETPLEPEIRLLLGLRVDAHERPVSVVLPRPAQPKNAQTGPGRTGQTPAVRAGNSTTSQADAEKPGAGQGPGRDAGVPPTQDAPPAKSAAARLQDSLAHLVVDAPAGCGAGGAAKLPVRVTANRDETRLTLTAASPCVRDIRLLEHRDDPFSNLLTETEWASNTWRISGARLNAAFGGGNATLTLRERRGSESGTFPECTVRKGADPIGALLGGCLQSAASPLQTTIAAERYPTRSLVLTSLRRGGSLELRYRAGDAATNVLESPLTGDDGLLVRLWRGMTLGVFVTWVLLSLGAPFWYDALKNLLKLRPNAAATEQQHRDARAGK